MGYRKWWLPTIILCALVIGVAYWSRSEESSQDIQMAFVDSEGITLKSISIQRRMINVVRVSSNVSAWIPGGLGWYESGKVKKLLEQEKQLEKAREILFFNFGFNPRIVKFSSESSNRDWWRIGNAWGWKNYLTYLYMGGEGLMTKEERVTGQLELERDFLATIMPRDFADSNVIEEGVKLSVYNAGSVDGLATTMARNLEWMGMIVYGVETVGKDSEEVVCKLVFGDGLEATKTEKYLKEIFDKCKWEHEPLLGEKEVELYLTDKYAEVINYQSYISN